MPPRRRSAGAGPPVASRPPNRPPGHRDLTWNRQRKPKEFENGRRSRPSEHNPAPRRVATSPGRATAAPSARRGELQQIVDVLKSDEAVGRSRLQGLSGLRGRREPGAAPRGRRRRARRRRSSCKTIEPADSIAAASRNSSSSLRERRRRAPASRQSPARTARRCGRSSRRTRLRGMPRSAFDESSRNAQPVLGRVGAQVGAGDLEQRPDHAVRRAAGCPARPARPGAANQPQQERLGLIVEAVADGDRLRRRVDGRAPVRKP